MGVIKGVVKLSTCHKLQSKFEPLSFICSENIGCPSILATSIHSADFYLVLVGVFVMIPNMFHLHYLSITDLDYSWKRNIAFLLYNWLSDHGKRGLLTWSIPIIIPYDAMMVVSNLLSKGVAPHAYDLSLRACPRNVWRQTATVLPSVEGAHSSSACWCLFPRMHCYTYLIGQCLAHPFLVIGYKR